MPSDPLRYDAWSATCDTLHAHTQLLGKLAVALAPREPGFQHLALQLDARGWRTRPLPLGSGAVVVRLDLHDHEAVVEHSDGRVGRVPLAPDQPVADVTRAVLEEVGDGVEINPTPQEVHWSVPLDEDREHATYDPDQVAVYFAAVTRAALVLAELRAGHEGRSTPVNAWWGSFDVAVSLYTADDREVAVGWWPGDPRYGRAAFYGYANPAPDGFADADLSPAGARWDAELGEFVFDWADALGSGDPHTAGLEFARSVLQQAGG